jgi:hypothetical protein
VVAAQSLDSRQAGEQQITEATDPVLGFPQATVKGESGEVHANKN